MRLLGPSLGFSTWQNTRHILLDKRAEMRRLLGRGRVAYRVTEIELIASFRFRRDDADGTLIDEEVVTRAVAEHLGMPYVHLDPLQLDYKLVGKRRQGSRIKRQHDKPKSPFQRVMDNPAVAPAVKVKLVARQRSLDPFTLKANTTRIQKQLLELQKQKGTAILHPGPSYPGAQRFKDRLFG